MYTIQIVGAGYTGSRIADFFVKEKQKVFALTRSEKKAEEFKSKKIQPIVADLMKPETLSLIPAAHFIVICVAPDESTEAAYEKTYLTGVSHYLKAIRKNPRPSLIVYFSSTGVWQDQAGGDFDETSEPRPQSAKARILVEAEKQVLNSGLPAAVLRLSGIYGPGRNRLKSFQEGTWPSVGPDRWMNLIHVDDIVESMPVFLKKAEEGQVYLGTDDEPVLCSTVCSWLASKTGLQKNPSFQGACEGRRLKNTRWKSLGVQLKYPTFREGYAGFLQEK